MEREYFKIMDGSCDFCHKLESQQKGTSFWLSRFSVLNVVTDKLENSKPRWIFNFKTLTTSCFTLHILSPVNNTTTKRDLWKQTKGQPYPFIYHFWRKVTPFVYLLLANGTACHKLCVMNQFSVALIHWKYISSHVHILEFCTLFYT